MGEANEITNTTVVTVPAKVLARKAADETVLLNLTSEMYFGLNQVGGRVWELVQDGSTVGAVVASLLDEFDVAVEVLEADVTSLLRVMADSGLVLLDAA